MEMIKELQDKRILSLSPTTGYYTTEYFIQHKQQVYLALRAQYV